MTNSSNFNEALTQFNSMVSKFVSISYTTGVLNWDSLTGAPKSGMKKRMEAIEFISGFGHEILINNEVKQNLDILLNNQDKLTAEEKALVSMMKREIDKIANVPKDKFQKYSSLTTQAQQQWEEAKGSDDFLAFEPYLTKIIDYLIEFADYRGVKGHPYNLYIDDYEEGTDVDQLNLFFKQIKERIVPLLKKIQEKDLDIDDSFLYKNYPTDKQEKVSRELLELIGFDFSRGLFTTSEHPFTSGLDIDDVRLTTHYHEKDFKSALLSTAHEGGHAIYEQNIDHKLASTPLATGASYAIHESQSRIYENNFFKSEAFLKYYFPKIKNEFPEQLNDVDFDRFYKAINKVNPSFIRIEADELTYCLHIMVRYELELQLIKREIDVKDLPKMWREKMNEYLGITPDKDSIGVLQDVHWSAGLFGYFPTYAIGSAMSAQIENTMRKYINVDDALEKGDFSVLTKWLNENVHKYGALLKPTDLLKKVTDEKLNPKYYCDYLEEKYTKIYDL